ncbi:GNAT family N-acetyltransferase [Ruminococcus sp. NK3A76]|uniref:GNAT family N-acetyltransferase n=1 Tax=Ruminococcus sp. NK3A76 TaxID=877411 RepID=UPI00048C3ED3|nr:GNAT family N-acetyltransferase [Ruminococcus sp. NK3A76]
MILRKADINDLDEIAAIESSCFPPEQAAGKEQFRGRLKAYPEHFLLLCEDSGKIVSFIDGFVTDAPDLTDEMYSDSALHDENGAWQMIFGLNTLPGYRRRGYAGQLIKGFLSQARAHGRRGAVLTCKELLIPYYEKFSFVNEGISDGSVIGGVRWYQMRRTF